MFLTNHSSAFLLHDVRVVKNVACLSSLISVYANPNCRRSCAFDVLTANRGLPWRPVRSMGTLYDWLWISVSLFSRSMLRSCNLALIMLDTSRSWAIFSCKLFSPGTVPNNLAAKACFIRRISVASNAIQTIDNEVKHLIIYCLNCFRRDWTSTYKTGLSAYSLVMFVNSSSKKSLPYRLLLS